MRSLTSPLMVRDSVSRRIEALHVSSTNSQHSVDGLNSLAAATRGLPNVAMDITTPGGSKLRLACVVTPLPLLSTQDMSLRHHHYCHTSNRI